jgi:hypothetical protein
MHLSTRNLFTLLTLVAALIGLLPLANAQDGPSIEEEQALLDRVADALEKLGGYESFVLLEESVQSQQIVITINGTETENTKEHEQTILKRTVIRGDNPSGSSIATVQYRVNDAGTPIIEYAVSGAFIYANGTLYGRASVTEGEADLSFPEGFIEIPDRESNAFSEHFDTDNFVGSVLGEEDENELFSNFEMINANYTSITANEREVNGERVEAIIVTFTGDDLTNLMSDAAPTEELAELFAAMDTNSVAQVTLFLAENNMPIGLRSVADISLTDFPFGDLDPAQLEGTTVSLILSISLEQRLSQINEDLEPIAAPQ